MPQKSSRKGKSPTPLVFPAPIPDTLENVTKSFFRRPKNKPPSGGNQTGRAEGNKRWKK